jgi:hypothetical protein
MHSPFRGLRQPVSCSQDWRQARLNARYRDNTLCGRNAGCYLGGLAALSVRSGATTRGEQVAYSRAMTPVFPAGKGLKNLAFAFKPVRAISLSNQGFFDGSLSPSTATE